MLAPRTFVRGTVPLKIAPGNEKRRHRRVQVGYRAGIQWFGKLMQADVVDASRSGIRIVSNCRLRVDGWVEIAVPYCKDSTNLFSPARVAWFRESATGKHEYGLQHYQRKDSHFEF